ncbi:MAG: hypothetical protein DWI29_04270 [Planctomycetota bacterium]|nr:MAG: hypothetical protein DWI29_04270 [Planctomycetota bacterium]
MNQSTNNLSFQSEASLAIMRARKLVDADGRHLSLSDHRLACHKIKQHRFCPPATIQTAVVALESPAAALRDEEFSEIIANARLNEFCLLFFSLQPEARKAVWDDLEPSLRPFPQLFWRLNKLKPGLSISAPAPNQFSKALPQAQDACDIFVMTPSAAANSLRRTCNEMTTTDRKVKNSKDALWEFKATYPEHASLHAPAVMPLADRLDRAVAKPRRPAQEKSSGRTSSRSGVGSFGWLLIVVIAGVIRFISTLSPFDNSRSYISPTNTSFNAESQKAFSRQMSELLKDSDPKLIESIFGKEKGKKFQDLKEKRRAAEDRLTAARERLEEIQGRSDNAKSASPVKEYATTFDSLKTILNAAAKENSSTTQPETGSKSTTATAAAKSPAHPSNAKMYIRLPNGKFIPSELGATWINYVENGASMTREERAAIEKILQEGSIDDPRKAAVSIP